ncbi:MAG: hypothetical protein EOO26_11285, partial [Comamonadaceae bacterium]
MAVAAPGGEDDVGRPQQGYQPGRQGLGRHAAVGKVQTQRIAGNAQLRQRTFGLARSFAQEAAARPFERSGVAGGAVGHCDHRDHEVVGARRAVVVAPHPDDEVLSVGGLLAMLSNNGAARSDDFVVTAITVTDGAASHTGSLEWPRSRLLRERP